MRLAWYDERVIHELDAHTHPSGSGVVADVGTGTGFVAAGLAPRVRTVIAIDHAPAILDVARANLAKLAIGGWVAVIYEVEHAHEWMRTEHGDIWLGFGVNQIAGFFGSARLEHYGYAPLGFSAWGQVLAR